MNFNSITSSPPVTACSSPQVTFQSAPQITYPTNNNYGSYNGLNFNLSGQPSQDTLSLSAGKIKTSITDQELQGFVDKSRTDLDASKITGNYQTLSQTEINAAVLNLMTRMNNTLQDISAKLDGLAKRQD